VAGPERPTLGRFASTGYYFCRPSRSTPSTTATDFDRYYVIILPAILITPFVTLSTGAGVSASGKPPDLHAAAGRSKGGRSIPSMTCRNTSGPRWSTANSNYNIYNSCFNELIWDSGLAILQADPGAMVYSNYVNALCFNTRPIHVLGVDNETPQAERVAALEAKYPLAGQGHRIHHLVHSERV
jgi:hypothetical protein